MKKNYLKLLLAGVISGVLPNVMAQQITEGMPGAIGESGAKHITLPLFNYSPDFHHEHEGEHCFADHITQHWIEGAGIKAQYDHEVLADAAHAMAMSEGERATYNLPIIFHVVYNTGAENVSATTIYNLFDMVNMDFSATNPDVTGARTATYGFTPVDSDIQFCLAAYDPSGTPLAELGIHRVSSSEAYFNPDTETNKMKSSATNGTDPWDRNQYINVWICDITNGAGSGTAGYAYKPTTTTLPPSSIDGIVIDYNLGTPPDNKVLTHELGHFLGLDHTWGGGSGSCTTDDGLTDTPNNAGPSFSFPGSCSGNQQTCPPTQTMYENYMDYSNCQCMYTAQQANLMNAVCAGSRVALTGSSTCTPLFPTPPVADFVADITTTVAGGSVNFTDLTTNWPSTWTWSSTPSAGVTYISGTSSTSQDPTMQFSIAGSYTIALTATNAYGSDTETKNLYITVNPSGGGAVACDTNRNYTAPELLNAAIYGITGEEGYYPSLATLGSGAFCMSRHADSYTVGTPTNVRRVRFPIYQVDDIGAASNVTFTVWSNVAGLPGAVLGTEVVALSSLDEGFWNEIDFIPQIPVAGTFWVGWQLSYAGGFDTLLMATVDFADRPSGASTSAIGISTYPGLVFNSWQLTSATFTGTPNTSLIFDVLTSNGPAPVSTVGWPPNETCAGMDVTFNGTGSANTTSYFWDIHLVSPSTDYYSDTANFTTTFSAGTWEIELFADGSCLTDGSGLFTLTVNPALAGSPTITNETCLAEDGALDFTPITGGSGSGMQYSKNAGATYQASPLFSSLPSGTYNYKVIDDGNCELEGSAIVDVDNAFAPTITPDQTIIAGTPTDLTVTGGTSWAWYAGADPAVVGTTATINVAPVVTTTYYCNVTDGAGCETELETTVSMDPSGFGEDDLLNGFTIYPNPTNGQFNLNFLFNESKDLQIDVVNVIGQKVLSTSLSGVKKQTVPVNVSVAEGVYFVVIRTDGMTATRKLVIRK